MKKCLFLLLCLGFLLVAHPQVQNNADSSLKKVYRETYTRINDLVHTKLEVRFDYAKAHMHGKAFITLTPHFYSTDSLLLDAKGMEIHKLSLVSTNSLSPLKYRYDGIMLNITLNRLYKAGEKYTINIDYTAKPNELKVKGSAAIADAKGLYFINPNGEDKETPTQIWTQGETEATSVWCPTIDKPNQKTTQEIYMTVPDKYVSLSNGKLVSQKKNADGTRTDYWNMDQPHAPYLFFMGVGDYAVVKDSYKGKEVSYYVEKEYAPVARKIFGHTPEMMAFFSKITGVDYPWVKYAQMVARDYVSGAMENTTATLHQENAQQDARELVDGNQWESTIAHELFHQWFGNLVTAESWSNLTLNESFANYSETLWDEYKYGKDAGAAQNYTDMQGYLNSKSNAKDLVRFKYGDKEDMFDAVSYNKGGRILHMLRNYLGDSAFFKGLNLYLTANKFKAAEAHHLRLALEEVSGKDLNWFFNQWYFGSGHPELDITYTYDDNARKVSVVVKQIQPGNRLFKLPLAIDIYNGPDKSRQNVWIEDKEHTFTFNYTARPDLVNVDANKVLLCEKKDNKSLENFIHQYKYAGNYMDRREAIEACAKLQDDPRAVELLKTSLKDNFHGLRNYTLTLLDLKKMTVKQAMEPIISDLARNEKKPAVKAKAISLLGTYNKPEYKSLFVSALNDSSYSVSGAALEAITIVDNAGSLEEVRKLKNKPAKGKLAETINQVLIESGTEEDFDIIARNFKRLPLGQEKIEALPVFSEYVARVNDIEKFKKGVDLIIDFKNDVPAAQQTEANPFFEMFLKGIMTKKLAALKGSNAGDVQQQIDYLKAKMEGKKPI
ncbi:MAG: M1 family metallopeptidase [Chitinophagaceae bacterium]